MKSGAAWLASAQQEEIDAFLGGLTEAALLALPWVFEFWALPHQLPPEGAWRTWVVMGGRGAGKTRAGAEWVRAQVEGARPGDPGRARRVALVAETIDQGREVMVMGDSGILACSPPDRRPKWIAGRNMLQWPNGAEARLFSAHDPESLRGPQFDAAWADELAKWPKAQETWDQLQFGLRLGTHPQQMVTTTPRNVDVLKAILQNPSTVLTRAPTEANRAYLAASYLAEVQGRYGGTQLGRQELLGELVEDVPDGLWSPALISAAQKAEPVEPMRVVVAVDPPVTATKTSGRIVSGGRVVELWHGIRARLHSGDRIRLTAGCDKRVETCQAKFANLGNFRGFPHIPGDDWLTLYPSSGQSSGGGSLFGVTSR